MANSQLLGVFTKGGEMMLMISLNSVSILAVCNGCIVSPWYIAQNN